MTPNLSKKKILLLTALVFIAIIGGFFIIRHQNNQQKATDSQQLVDELTQNLTKGKLYKQVYSLMDQEKEFLIADLQMDNLTTCEKELSKSKNAVKTIESDTNAKINLTDFKKASDSLDSVIKNLTAMLNVQDQTNKLFETTVINGDQVTPDLPIAKDISMQMVSTIENTLDETAFSHVKWKKAITKIVEDARNQVVNLDALDELIKKMFVGEVPKTSITPKEYDDAVELCQKVKNDQLRQQYQQKLDQVNVVLAENKKKREEEQKKKREDELKKAAGLDNYTDKQIEYARVWLMMIGNNMIKHKAPNYAPELVISQQAAGSPISPYDKGSVTYPVDVTFLSGAISADGLVVYHSNNDGTVTIYNVPSHWHLDPKDSANPDFVKKFTQDILDNAEIRPIEDGDPADVKTLIEIQTSN